MKKRYWIPLVIILFFVALHFALEPIALRQVNKALANMEGYRGEVEKINIHLYRGAYQIDSLRIISEKQEKKNEEDYFFTSKRIEIALEWKALFRGRLVGDVELQQPVLNFISDGKEVDDGEEVDFVKVLNDMVPFQINSFRINKGEIHYIDEFSDPQIDIFMKDLDVLATNLGNINQENEELPSTVSLSGSTIGGGIFQGTIDMNVLKQNPDFDAQLELDQMDLTALNEFTKAYANFTFEEGELYVSTEIAMDEGVFKGYVKPLFENIQIVDLQNEETSFWRKAWEGLVGAAFDIFKNPATKRSATKVPFEGDTNNTDVKVLPTIFNVLKNTFIEAFEKDLDNSIRYEDLQPS